MAKIKKTETSNMEYLISLGFETDLEQLSSTVTSVKELDKYIDKMATSMKSYETVAKALGLNIKDLITSLNGIKEPSQLFAKFKDSLQKAGIEFEGVNQYAIKVTKAFTGLGKEAITLSQNGALDSVVEKSQAAIGMQESQSESIKKILDDQTELVTKTMDLAGANKTTKEQFKKSIEEMIASYSVLSEKQQTEIINNLDQYTNKLQVSYNKQGQIVEAWVDVNIDEYTRLRQYLKLFETESVDGKIKATAFERVGGPKVVDDFKSARQAVLDLLDSYTKLKAKTDELSSSDNLSKKQEKDLIYTKSQLQDVVNELGKYGVKVEEASGKLETFATDQKTSFIDIGKAVENANKKISENADILAGKNYDKVFAELEKRMERIQKLTKEQSTMDQGTQRYAEWDKKIQEAEASLTNFKNTQAEAVLGAEKLAEAQKKHEEILKQINADANARKADKATHQEEIEQLSKLKSMYQELSKLRSTLAQTDIGTKKHQELNDQITKLKGNIDNLIKSQEENKNLYNQLINVQNQYEESIEKTSNITSSGKEDEILKKRITLIEKLVKEYQELLSVKRKNESGVTDLNNENIELVNKSMEELNNQLKQQGVLVDETTGKIEIDWKKVNEVLKETQKSHEDLEKVQKELNELAEKRQVSDSQAKYNKDLSNYIKDLKELYKAQRDLQKMEFGKANLSDLEQQREVVQKIKDKLSDYSDEVKNSTKATEEFNRVERQLNSDLKTLENGLNRVGLSFGSVFNKLKESAQHALIFGSINKVVDLMGDAVMQSVEKVRELDQVMTNIQLVTGQTDEETRQLVNTYSQMAKQLGATTKEVADGYCVAILKSL